MSEMSMERAHEINGAMCDRKLISMGLDRPTPASLEGVSLREMLDAAHLVQRENEGHDQSAPRPLSVVPDDRLIAAIYAFEHYDAGEHAILSIETDGMRRMLGIVEATVEPEAANDAELAHG